MLRVLFCNQLLLKPLKLIQEYLEESNRVEIIKKSIKTNEMKKNFKLTCKKLSSKRINVMNMNANKIRPANCITFLGLLSPSDGTPANKLRPSTLDSAKTSNKAPINAKFLNKNCMSHKIEYATVYLKKV